MRHLAAGATALAALLLSGLPSTAKDCKESKQGCFLPEMKRTCVDFEKPLDYGVKFRGPWNYAQNGIRISLEPYRDQNGNTNNGGFGIADPFPSGPFGGGTAFRFNNADLLIYVGGLGFPVAGLDFEFLDLGGAENLSARSSPVWVGDLVSAPSPMDGIDVWVSGTPVSGGLAGRVTMHGDVGKFIVGGQELWIDNICVYPLVK